MNWSEKEEALWASMTKRRAASRDNTARTQMVVALRQLADSLERGDVPFCGEISVEWLYREGLGYHDRVPYAKKITVVVPISVEVLPSERAEAVSIKKEMER